MPITETSEEVLITVATTAWSYTPASPLVTDEIIWLAFSVNASSGSITSPTDGSTWTYPNTQTLFASGSAAMVWAWHKVTAGENGTTPTYDFTGASTTLTIHAVRIQGADTTSPINAFGQRTDVDTTRTMPAISSSVDGCTIYAGTNLQSASSQSVAIPASGWVELQNSSGENAGRGHVVGRRTALQTIAGSVATDDFSSTSSLGGIVWALAVAPAGAGSSGSTIHRWVGGVTKTRLRFGVKTSGATAVRVGVSTVSDLSSGVVYSSSAAPSTEGWTKHEITGLTAGTTYYYAIERDSTLDTTSILTTKTFPSGDSFKFAFASCLQNNSATSAIFDQMDNVFGADFFLHLGDWHYDDNSTATVASQEESMSSQIVANSRLGSFIAKVPTMYETSDHDAGANNFSPGPQTHTPFLRTALTQMMPHYDLPDSAGLQQSFVVGRVRFIMLDTRSYRSANSATDNSSKTMLGATQKAWLFSELSQPEPVKVISMDCPWIGAAVAGDDDWTSFTTERTEIANYITSNNIRAIILHGDAHMLAADNGTNSPGGITVFCAAPLSQSTSTKGGPYSEGFYPNPVGATGHQAGLVTVTDSGDSIALAFNGVDDTGTSRITLTKTFNLTGVLQNPPPKLKYWNGSNWVVVNKLKYWNGSAWATPKLKAYN